MTSKTDVQYINPTPISQLALGALSLILTGCSILAPGHEDVSSGKLNTQSNGGWTNFSAPPKNVIIQITPEVIKTINSLQNEAIPANVSALFSTPEAYTIGPGDVVGIVVYDHPELMPSSGAVITQQADPTGISTAPGLIVNAAGEIVYPYIGRIKVSGLTEVEATELISKKLSNVIQTPQVTLRIQSFRSRRAYVEGQVATPGIQLFTDRPMTLIEAINRAGGITSDGDRSNIALIRNGIIVRIDIAALQEKQIDLNQIILRNGDIIQVRNRDERKIYVMGETLRASSILMRDGQLSLGQALGESGGVNLSTSDPGQIYVIRRLPDNTPTIFHLDAKNPAMLAIADGFNLHARDVVYIDPVPLVRWNRIISLILPSASVLNAGSEISSR
ncbi:polysaccharide biosynthesis/export family protein [Comamonadaceae bacterium PP-2]